MPGTKKRVMILKTSEIDFIYESEIRHQRLPKFKKKRFANFWCPKTKHGFPNPKFKPTIWKTMISKIQTTRYKTTMGDDLPEIEMGDVSDLIGRLLARPSPGPFRDSVDFDYSVGRPTWGLGSVKRGRRNLRNRRNRERESRCGGLPPHLSGPFRDSGDSVDSVG